VEGAINPDANVPAFVKQFNAPFPVGLVDNMAALNYMELSPVIRSFVPFMLFIDRKGMIRAEYTGSDEFFANQQEQRIKEEALKLLAEPGASATSKSPAKKSK